MDVNKILEDLRRERTQLEEAILSLERLAVGSKRRGRPPSWIAAAQERAGAKATPAAKEPRAKKKSHSSQGG